MEHGGALAYFRSHPALTPGEVDVTVPFEDKLANAPSTSWWPAEVIGVLRYVRGCKSLQLPAEYRKCFPQFVQEGVDPVRDESWWI